MTLESIFEQRGRSKGRHVSDAIYRIMRDLHPDRFDGSPIDTTRAMLGNAVEHAIVGALAGEHPQRYVRPGELILDGIYGTPDLWDLTDWCTVEVKLTWASSRRADDIEDPWFWRYWIQLKSYVHMSGQTKGRLIVVFVNGNYEGSGPELVAFEDEWSREELEEVWAMISHG